MAKKKDRGFTGRALMALATALADRNCEAAEIIVAALAKEHWVTSTVEQQQHQITPIHHSMTAPQTGTVATESARTITSPQTMPDGCGSAGQRGESERSGRLLIVALLG
jgi:hypothetical protein